MANRNSCLCVQYFTEYGPSFDLDVMPCNMRNLNSEAYIESVISSVLSMCTLH